jgi:hypothetical protein
LYRFSGAAAGLLFRLVSQDDIPAGLRSPEVRDGLRLIARTVVAYRRIAAVTVPCSGWWPSWLFRT